MIRRDLFNLCGLLASILCLIVTCMWVRSYWMHDTVEWLRDSPGASLWIRRIFEGSSARGGLKLNYIRSPATAPGAIRSFREDAKIQPVFKHGQYRAKSTPAIEMSTEPSVWRSMGFGFDSSFIDLQPPPKVRMVQIVFPYWSVVAVLLFPCVMWVTSWHRAWSRNRSRLCLICGYDLRATPDRCPECGTVVAKS